MTANNAASPHKPAVLIVDCDKGICDLLESNLARDYSIDTSPSAEHAMARDLTRYALVVLEINFPAPGINGLEMARRLHDTPRSAGVPLIFCTARDSEDDIIQGFDAGADDYVVKPFSLREMVARIRSVIRRHSMSRLGAGGDWVASPTMQSAPAVIRHGTLSIHLENQRVESAGTPVALSRTEFMILALLAKDPGTLFTRDEIHRRVWANNPDNGSRAVDVNISRLRKKLGPHASRIVNYPGQGYSFE